jgi:hypothetical protein
MAYIGPRAKVRVATYHGQKAKQMAVVAKAARSRSVMHARAAARALASPLAGPRIKARIAAYHGQKAKQMAVVARAATARSVMHTRAATRTLRG